MADFSVSAPNCVASDNFFDSDCGSKGYARFLFISWNILSMYIFVNMVCLKAHLLRSVAKPFYSSCPLSSKASAMSTNDREVTRMSPERIFDDSKERGHAMIHE